MEESSTISTSCIDRNYARSYDGVLKLVQAVVLLIAFICIQCSRWTFYSIYRYFEVVIVWFLIAALIYYFLYLTRLHLKITCLKWSFTGFLHNVVATILLFIASVLAAAKSYSMAGLAAGSFFGFVATVLFGVNAWLDYKMWRDPQPAPIFT